ncbi:MULTISPECIES: hypothetical protein [unclassified Paenibacillus]|uniref:hypothetical protein n=1 Tax=unclassified Paenibacillus TaxID=185978 RepID=UPI000CFAD0A6|nr:MULTISPECIES: hypothetical protein [unclassified Paenibacillus]PRA08887.1 hypothetical protein CQ043_02605 [Paenibacillus sp. MYb63]PRA48821.1 hypothetical protein CQ061_11060 [Paenibacillus sp. MYb67]
MKIRKVLELSIDVDNVFNDLPHILRALLDTMPDSESKLALLNTIKMDVDHFLKGAETNGEPLRESGRK